jgi:hypothetical protein
MTQETIMRHLFFVVVLAACGSSQSTSTNTVNGTFVSNDPNIAIGHAAGAAAVGLARTASAAASGSSEGTASHPDPIPAQPRYDCATIEGDHDEIIAESPERATAICEELSGLPCSCAEA